MEALPRVAREPNLDPASIAFDGPNEAVVKQAGEKLHIVVGARVRTNAVLPRADGVAAPELEDSLKIGLGGGRIDRKTGIVIGPLNARAL